jgi:hypothetical protein
MPFAPILRTMRTFSRTKGKELLAPTNQLNRFKFWGYFNPNTARDRPKILTDILQLRNK